MKGLPLAEETSGAIAWQILWILFVLVVIVGLIVFSLRALAKRNRGWGMNRTIRSLGGYALGPNNSLQIIEWNGRIYVLGVGDDVTLIDAITDPETAAMLLADHDAEQDAMAPVLPEFIRKLTKRSRWANSADYVSEEAGRDMSFEESLQKRLRQLAERRQRAEQLLEDKPSSDERSNNL